MENVLDFVIELKNKEIFVQEFNGQLKLTGKLNAITEKDKERIKLLKPALMEFLIGRKNMKSSFCVIPEVKPADSYPVAASQRRLWILSQFEGGSVAYNIDGMYIFEGNLSVPVVEKAFSHLVKRHEMLRTVFREDENGEIRQYIQNENDLNFHLFTTDLRDTPDPFTAVKPLLEQERKTPFDLANGPLLKVSLFQTANDQWILSYVMHHIISDGWSMGVLIKELEVLYNAFMRKADNPLAPLRIQYKEYVAWQHEQLSAGQQDINRSYWHNKYAGEFPVIDLPTDRPRPAIKTYNGGFVSRTFKKELVQKFDLLLKSENATMFMGVLSLVNTLLYRYSNQEDIIIGSPVAGRDHVELENQIGLYLNTLAFRTQFKGDDSFINLLKNVRDTTLDAFEHQLYPFDELIDDLKLQRDMSRNPLFDIMVVFQNSNLGAEQSKAERLEGLTVRSYQEDIKAISKFDLNFMFTADQDEMTMLINYNSDLYNRETVEKISEQMENLLASVVAMPGTLLQKLEFMNTEERNWLLYKVNDTTVPFNEQKTLVDVFNDQVLKTPAGIAVDDGSVKLTYNELNKKVEALAAQLISKCRKEDVYIAVHQERSVDLIVSLLAVLKSGKAYVPVDPTVPTERKKVIFNSIACSVIITDTENMVLSQELDCDLTIINVNDPVIVESVLPSQFPLISSTDIAYIIFTSGSTGVPKGVVVQHRPVINLIEWITKKFRVNEKEKVLCTASASFDLSVYDIFGILAVGGCVRIASNAELKDPLLLTEILYNEGITFWDSAPAVMQQLVPFFDGTRTSSLRLVFFSGDWIPLSLPDEVKNGFSGAQVIGLGGATEATVWSNFFPIQAIDPSWKSIPYGRPIQNAKYYVLNAALKPVPTGVVADLYIGGEVLALGYNDPELSAKKFIVNPHCPGERIYHTGDKARFFPDGNIEFMGRVDNQVKVRGFRIELGDIEAALLNLPGIRAAVVIAVEKKLREKELVAYVVSNELQKSADLRNLLQKKLPAYMVPLHIIQLNEIPLTPNGKVDRKALPLPDVTNEASVEYIAPRNSTEERLLEIWEDVLDIEKGKLSVKDNFFERGGHSLKATRLLSKIFKAFEIKFGLKEVFEHVILEEQALLLDKSKRTAFRSIEALPVQEDYPISSAQRRLWVLSQLAEGSAAYNMPGVFIFEGNLQVKTLENAFMRLIGRHEILRTVFRENNQGDVRQVIKPIAGFDFNITEMDLRESSNNNMIVHNSVQADAGALFDLRNGPLLRVSLYRMEDKKWVFSYVLHHIISDGWSMEILIRELLLFYNSEIENSEVSLEPLRIHYKDYAAAQQEELSGKQLQQHKSYWLEQFKGELPVLELPSDHIRPAIKTYNGAIIKRIIPKEQTEQLKGLARDANSTLFMTLIGVIKTLLYRYTGQEDIIIGSPSAGREHADLDNQIGFFVNTLALRTRFSGTYNFRKLLGNIREVTMEAYEHQVYPFDELVDELKLTSDTSRQALFDIMVVLQNTDIGGRNPAQDHLGDLSVSNYTDSERIISLFDLRFDFNESGGQLQTVIEYNTDIYNKERILLMADHFENLLKAIVNDPEKPISRLEYISEQEKNKVLFDFNDTLADYPKDKTLVQLFAAQVKKHPDMTAVTDEEGSYTFAELDKHSSRLAHFLLKDTGVKKEDKIGIFQSQNKKMLVSVMAVLKAGAAYVPMDTTYPEERLLYILEDAGISVMLMEKNTAEFSNRLQWRSKNLKHIVCIDSTDIYSERGTLRNELMRKDLWDHVGDTAPDAISGGGWMSSYTGEDFSTMEMEEYSRNAYLKLKDKLHPGMKVLEIGCSSGLTMFSIASDVSLYCGTDLSSSILENTKISAREKGFNNIELHCMPAHEIDQLEQADFDLVIINSVIHCFDGHNYLREVLLKAVNKLKKNGFLFLGDLMDEEKRLDLIADMEAFRHENRGKGYRTKTEWSSELFVARDYLDDLISDGIGITKTEYSGKIFTIANELTRFRYDALLTVDKNAIVQSTRKKMQHDVTQIQKHEATIPETGIGRNNLAYVIYTSGSTGNPKGCMLEHGGVINRIEWMWQAYGFDVTDVILQKTTFTFDVSVWELLMPLCWGTRMVLCNKDDIASPDRILSLIHQHNITCLHFVPSMLNTFINELFDDSENILKLSGLRRVITSGEALSVETVKRWYSKTDIVIQNLYGPTEASIDVTYYQTAKGDTKIPIGRPIWNTQMYVLDSMYQPVPVGINGEICIAGDGLARGYLNKPELSAEKFVVNPFNSKKRMYTTGDIGRWLPDGNIEYLGRKDHQVKIRGYRIELGEIETALRELDLIKDCVVVAVPDAKGEKNLAAYIVSDEELKINDLRTYLGNKLPSYMIPAYFVALKEIPLSANGKADRKKLPSPEGSEMATGVEYIAPRNELETEIVRIWESILNRNAIGAKDDFFELGGHSLKMTQLISQYHRAFSVKLTLKDIFKNATVENHAALIHTSKRTDYAVIGKIEEAEDYPLSDGQHRLWVLSQFEAGSVAYNRPASIPVKGRLDLGCFEKALYAVIERHEILRTVFVENSAGEVRQKVLPAADSGFNFVRLDLRKEVDKLEAVMRFMENDAIAPFDLSTGPLFRAAIIEMEDEHAVFYYNMHHIISDGWSIDVLSKDVLELYAAFANGKVNPLPPLRIQYKDYTVWQQSQEAGEVLEQQRSYWLNQFAGEIPVLEMPQDHPRPLIKTYNGSSLKIEIPVNLAAALKNYSRRNGGTLFIGLLAAVKILLSRYSSQKDIIIGSPIAGRLHADLENQIGFYVNTLALRTVINEEESFASLFEKVKLNTFNAFANQMYPFDRLVDELNLKRDTSRFPLFDVMVALQNTGEMAIAATENETDLKDRTTLFDLNFNFIEYAESLLLKLEYNTDLYSEVSVKRIGEHLRQLIAVIISDPAVSIDKIEYITDKEKQQLRLFNDTAVAYDTDANVMELFVKQVLLTPDAIAFVFEDKKYTYAQLNTRVNQFAHYIRKKGNICQGDHVCVLLDRSEYSVIAMISIMKLGAVYIPIDKSIPESRIRFMIEESNSGVLITDVDPSFAKAAGLQENIELISADEDVSQQEESDPLVKISGKSPSFIIYTSGSTGKPKGVVQTHIMLYNLVSWDMNASGMLHGQKHLQFSSFSFDSSLHDVYYALATGGEVHVISEALRKDLWSLKDYILHNKISTLSMPYAALKVMFSEIGENEFNGHSIREIISTGEQLYITGGLRNFLEKNTAVRIFNLYGPSETHVVTGVNYSASDSILPVRTSIGKPVHNTVIYILDGNMKQVPVGVYGEIYIGGWNLALGYHGQPEMTAMKFINDPFIEGALIYKSGDIGKWLANGEIEYKMRADNQLKIRGYRIELGEIESSILEYEQMEEVIVLAKENSNSEKILVAYFVSKVMQNITEIRSFLRSRLPDYMIPAFFIQLEKIPLTTNGKVDKRMFPDPDSLEAVNAKEYTEPANETEKKLAGIWSVLLGRKKISSGDDFFELGGNSLTSIRMIAQVRNEFDIQLKLEVIFNGRVLAAIAAEIDTLLWLKNTPEENKMNADTESLTF